MISRHTNLTLKLNRASRRSRLLGLDGPGAKESSDDHRDSMDDESSDGEESEGSEEDEDDLQSRAPKTRNRFSALNCESDD